jgi:polyisoprenoid-binding protein YceI
MKATVILFACLLVMGYSSHKTSKEKEKVEFSIPKGFGTVEGYFKQIEYDIKITDGNDNSVNGKAEVGSIYTGNTKRDKHLQNEDWFFAKNYPQINIQSKQITKLKENEYKGKFDITIKNMTTTKEIPFKIRVVDGKKFLVSTFNLSIEDYNIGGGFVSMLVGDQVTVNLNLPF